MNTCVCEEALYVNLPSLNEMGVVDCPLNSTILLRQYYDPNKMVGVHPHFPMENGDCSCILPNMFNVHIFGAYAPIFNGIGADAMWDEMFGGSV